MKIFTASQIKKWDTFTIEEQGISSEILMERAAQKCVEYLLKKFKNNEVFCIFCGSGNNGGDGLAIARLLYFKGFDVEVFLDIKFKYSSLSLLNLNKLIEISSIIIHDLDELQNHQFTSNSVIIDALFGIGSNRKVEGKIAEIISFLNKLDLPKISIDLPSGSMADELSGTDAVIFKADETLTFQSWKKTLLHPESGIFAGKVQVLDINLSEKFAKEERSENFIIEESLIKIIYRPRNEFSHKGNYGKTIICAGSYGKIGAAVFSTRAALKTGSGITFTLAPNCGYEILQTTCPEAMYISGGKNNIENFDVDAEGIFGIGPGLGTSEKTSGSFLNFLKDHSDPMVLDADALNILSKDPDLLKFIPKNSIITPHPKEFERLFGKTANSFERQDLAIEQAEKLGIFIVLKDHHTQIITPKGEVFYNVTGNSGMAKGGSGDVLLGIITSLLSQNYSSKDAAIFGVWLHGKAGDLAAEKYSKEAMLPSDLINEIGNIYKYIAEKRFLQNF